MTARENRLKLKGWTRRSVACEPCLSEMKELYEDLGFDVRLEPFDEEEEEGGCSVCLAEHRESYRVVYTRPGSKGSSRDDGPAKP